MKLFSCGWSFMGNTIHLLRTQTKRVTKCTFTMRKDLLKKYLSIYLAVLGLSHGTWDL